MFETERQKREIQRWSKLAIQLNGAVDTGQYEHVTVDLVVGELRGANHIFDLLVRELPASVWEICKLTDVDRHMLAKHWQMMATAYEPSQFHVTRNGLSLLVAYLMHLIDLQHSTTPL